MASCSRAVLRQHHAERAGDLLHGLHLGVAAHAGDGDAGVDGGALALVEEAGLEEDLAVGDGDDVGGDVGGDVVGLGLDDRQGGHRAAALGFGELGGALQQTAVEVEDVAGEGLAARRAAQEQGHLAIGLGVLGQVVINDEGVAAAVHPILGHRAPGVRRQILERRGLGGVGQDDGGVGHRAGVLELLVERGDGGELLAHGHVEAVDVTALLVEDGVDGDGGLAGLAVADDQLALAAADGGERVDGHQAGLHRGVDVAALDDGGGGGLHGHLRVGGDGALAIQRAAEGVDHAPGERGAGGHGDDAPGAVEAVALAHVDVAVEDGHAHHVLLQVQRQAGHAVLGLDQLVVHHAVQAVHAGDAVAHAQHRAELGGVDPLVRLLHALAEEGGELIGFQLVLHCDPYCAKAWRRRRRRPFNDPSNCVWPARTTSPAPRRASVATETRVFGP